MKTADSIDELFGGGSISTPSSLPKAIVQRVGELRQQSCRQQITYSKMGGIAYISGSNVVVRNLCTMPEDGTISAAPEQIIPMISRLHVNQKLVHLSWISGGSELAIIDALGRITICSTFICVNRLQVQRLLNMDAESDYGAVVAHYNLVPERPHIFFRQATRNEAGQFNYPAAKYQPYGPYNPVVRTSSLVYLTRNGTIKLSYLKDTGGWDEISYELEHPSCSNDLITHASFSSDKDNLLLLAVYTRAGVLRLYKIQIAWTGNKERPSPAMQVKALTKESVLAEGQGVLSHLEVLSPLPPQPQTPKQDTATILLVFSHMAINAADSFSTLVRFEITPTQQEIHSSFNQLSSHSSTNARVFPIIALHRIPDITVPKIVITIEKVNHCHNIALGLHDGSIIFYNRIFKIPELNKNPDVNFDLLTAGFSYPPDTQILDMALSPNLCCAAVMSPEFSIRTMVGPKQEEKTTTTTTPELVSRTVASMVMPYLASMVGNTISDDLSLLLAGLDLPPNQLLSEVYHGSNIRMSDFLSGENERIFRQSYLCRCLGLQSSLGYTGYKKGGRTISSNVAFISSQLRLASLILQHCFNTKTAGQNTSQGGPQVVGVQRPEILTSLFGLVHWHLTLCNYIFDSFFLIMRKAAIDKTTPFPYSAKAIDSRTETPALALVFSPIPRTLLRYVNRALTYLENNVKELTFEAAAASKSALPLLPKEKLESIAAAVGLRNIMEKFPVRQTLAETLLVEVENLLKEDASSSSSANGEKAHPRDETKYFITSKLSDLFRESPSGDSSDEPTSDNPLLKKLFTEKLPEIFSTINAGEIYFTPFESLGLPLPDRALSARVPLEKQQDSVLFRSLPSSDPKDWTLPQRPSPSSNNGTTAAGGGDANVNAGNNAILFNRVRRCTRCCNLTADLPASLLSREFKEQVEKTGNIAYGMKGLPPWVKTFARGCGCGVGWMLVV